MKQQYYKIAQQVFSIGYEPALAEQLVPMLKPYEPFEIEASETTFNLHILVDDTALPASFASEYTQDEEGQVIKSGHLGDGSKVFGYEFGAELAVMQCSSDYRQAELRMDTNLCKAAIDTSLMLLFALTTANQGILLFHSSTVVWKGKAYMFLGKSGTGKSTHSCLWLKHIAGTHLLNDDNPVVRIDADGKPIVCGSPWSGKTPCYRNEEYPLGAIVQLQQAPKNQIFKSSVLEAYAALTASISSKRWEKDLANGIHASVEAILQQRPIYLLKCLPDQNAAQLCWRTIAKYSFVDDVKSIIDEGRPVVLPVNGNSMLPFIYGGEKVELHPLPTKLHKGDIVLAKVKEGYPVIHRIVWIEGEEITLEGDGNLGFQEHCQLKDVIAQATFVILDSDPKKGLSCRTLTTDLDLSRWLTWWKLPLLVRRVLLKLCKMRHHIKNVE